MLDFFGRRSLFVGRAYEAFFGPRPNVLPSTNDTLIVTREHDNNNNNIKSIDNNGNNSY